VHTLAVHLAPVLAAEKSKAPFFIAGGLLVGWALFVSLAMGMRNPKFPGNLGGQRVVSAITALLVLAAAGTAVITSGGEAKAGAESAKASHSQEQYGANTPDTAAPESANKAPAAATGGSTAPAESTPAASAPTASTPAKTTPAKKTPAKKETPKATTGTPAPPSSPAAAATTLKLAANPAGQLAYTTKSLSAKAGKVTIDFSNASPVEHDVAIAQGSTVAGQTPVFTGGSKTLTITLKPGSYTFYCTVPGHRAAGMEGTLTVS
jgi:plastocyanin